MARFHLVEVLVVRPPLCRPAAGTSPVATGVTKGTTPVGGKVT
ncbi:hypothetical protein GA0074694_1814 [Micromonospora inyonensis]|uniref:Uncharacterized protein n=1 Tax=Micromonospora inyonensis TaxID=47866 RepID=A0A1C6RIN0_9ACTN|nr:hypothetical protein GA0074694_1814 [Micromonospora inyonensis]